MKTYTLIVLLIVVLVSCGKSPRERGAELGNELCNCLNSSNKENCSDKVSAMIRQEAESIKSSPSDIIEFTAGYTEVTQKCYGNEISKITGMPSEYSEKLKSVNTISTSSFSFKNIELKFYLFSLLLIALSILLSYFGVKYYATGLSLSFVIPVLSFLFVINWYGPVLIATTLVLGLGIFIFSKPLTYFIGWFWVTFFIYLIPALFEPPSDISTYIIYTAMCLAAIVIYFFRKELKRYVIALGASFSFSLGVSMIVSYQSILNHRYSDALMWPTIILLFATIVSFAYQYRVYLLPNKPAEEPNLIKDSDDANIAMTNSNISAITTINKNLLYVGIAIAVSLIAGLVIFLTVNNKDGSMESNVVLNQAALDSIEQQRIADSTLEAQEILMQLEQGDTNKNESQNIQPQSEEPTYEQSEINNAESTDWCIGTYTAVFNNNPMQITISDIFTDGTVTGTCLYKGTTTALTGKLGEVKVDEEVSGKTVNSVEVILNEPQGKSNGTFRLFFVTPFGNHGTWTSYDGKLTRELTDIEMVD